jgi:hypothetical protein
VASPTPAALSLATIIADLILQLGAGRTRELVCDSKSSKYLGNPKTTIVLMRVWLYCRAKAAQAPLAQGAALACSSFETFGVLDALSTNGIPPRAVKLSLLLTAFKLLSA